jgi:outer membrane protein
MDHMETRHTCKLAAAIAVAILIAPRLRADELKLDDAIKLALEKNREVTHATIEHAKAADRYAAFRTNLFPTTSVSVTGVQQLQRFNFTIEKGTLGNYGATGPLPDHDVKFSTPLEPTALVQAKIAQPLTQLRRIRLNLKLIDLSASLAKEDLRARRLETVRNVKQIYYNLQQVEASLRAARESITLYRELERLSATYVARQTALEADHLEAQTRLAKAEQSELELRDQSATLKEQLNQLMGRDLLADFSISEPGEASADAGDIDSARRRALEQRSEVRQSDLKIAQAELDVRVKRSEAIPDVSVELSTTALANYGSFLPNHFSTVGFSLTWQPFDWGKRKHEIAERQRTVEQSRNAAGGAREKVLIEVNQKYRAYERQKSQIRIAKLSQQTALENLRVIRKKFEAEASLQKDVLENQAHLEQAHADYRQALAKLWDARAELEHAMGEDQ